MNWVIFSRQTGSIFSTFTNAGEAWSCFRAMRKIGFGYDLRKEVA